ncbi:MAG: hypothetical protein QJR03_12180 [Sphaerobacter sp.]|nr:hypothetical protein [Sphaerobacter sp.]
MSRQNVRQAFAQSLRSVAALKTVFDAEPKIVQGQDMPAAYVAITRSEEKRIANQQRMITYTVEARVGAAYPTPKSEDAQTQFDAVLDAVVAQIRTDKTLGGKVLRSGERIRVEVAEPAVDQQTTALFAVVETDVDELINGA